MERERMFKLSRALFPPVFVMNLYYTGIGIARNLYGTGVKVYGLSCENKSPGMKSRFFDGIYHVPDGSREPDALCEWLVKIKAEYPEPPVIFPTRDFDVLFLHRYKNQLAPFYYLAQPNGESVPRLLDKFEISRLASLIQIPVPKTVICSSLQDIDKKIGFLQFPLVAKPRFAYQWRQKGAWEKVGARKAILVESADQLKEEYRQLASVKEEVLLQEYISGPDSDIVVCCCYTNKNGDLVGYFTAKKLRQNPPFFGTGCVVELVNVPEIVAPSVQLLQTCGYAGLAEVEFKYDEGKNTFFLIEINPRHWDQHELGKFVGINLTWIAYQDIIGRHPKPQIPAYNESIKYKWIAERETFLLLIRNAYLEIGASRQSDDRINIRIIVTYLSVIRKAIREFFFLIRGRKVFAIFDPCDPIPGVLMVFRLFLELSKIFISHVWKKFFGKRAMTIGGN